MYRPKDVRPGELLCRLDDLEDPGSKGFRVHFDDGGEVDMFVVRRGPDAFAYLNICPHQFLPLNWHTDIFLTFDKTQIVCVMHAARFEMESGEMVYGPVAADCRLTPVPITNEGGCLRLAAQNVPRF
ncbi:MAG: Rieske 2Fe-2S domain-containing protein [Alphaproteobacteria bacterium]|nr:Rieske 2Fe-2S domain-containing protein [Alphaproteobacteria bacterium]